MSPTLKRLLVIAAILIAALLSIPFLPTEKAPPPIASNPQPQIRVLRLHFSGTEVTLQDLGNFPGSAKRQRNPSKQNAFYYQVSQPNTALIAEGSFPDPRILYYDTPVDDSGKLQGGSIIQESTVFDIRLPRITAASTFTLFDYTDSQNTTPILAADLPPLP